MHLQSLPTGNIYSFEDRSNNRDLHISILLYNLTLALNSTIQESNNREILVSNLTSKVSFLERILDGCGTTEILEKLEINAACDIINSQTKIIEEQRLTIEQIKKDLPKVIEKMLEEKRVDSFHSWLENV